MEARAELPRSYLQYPLVDKGVTTDVAKWVSANMHTDIRGEYVVRIHGGIVGEPNELRKIVRVRGRQRTLGTIKLSALLRIHKPLRCVLSTYGALYAVYTDS